jgi:hypothetical protein
VDLLVRAPVGDRSADEGPPTLGIDPAAQLARLSELRRRRLLSAEEYERQRAIVLGDL